MRCTKCIIFFSKKSLKLYTAKWNFTTVLIRLEWFDSVSPNHFIIASTKVTFSYLLLIWQSNGLSSSGFPEVGGKPNRWLSFRVNGEFKGILCLRLKYMESPTLYSFASGKAKTSTITKTETKIWANYLKHSRRASTVFQIINNNQKILEELSSLLTPMPLIWKVLKRWVGPI